MGGRQGYGSKFPSSCLASDIARSVANHALAWPFNHYSTCALEPRQGEVRSVPPLGHLGEWRGMARSWIIAVVSTVTRLAAGGATPSEVAELSLSEHGVVVRRALRYGLHYIPVLDNLAVFQAEDVRYRRAAVFG
jgi:hypothetical protein